MHDLKRDKINRILGIYDSLSQGKFVNKSAAALHYNVNERSIQRDIDDIPEKVREQLEFVLLKKVDDALKEALV